MFVHKQAYYFTGWQILITIHKFFCLWKNPIPLSFISVKVYQPFTEVKYFVSEGIRRPRMIHIERGREPEMVLRDTEIT